MNIFYEDGKLNYITKSNKLLYRNCYLYDIKSCNVEILKRFGYKFIYDQLIKMNKDERNINIGHLAKYFPAMIRNIDYNIHTIIKYFIKENNLKESDIIFIQKDGLLLNKYVKNNNKKLSILPELRSVFSYVVFSEDKRSYLGKDELNHVIITKGVKNKSIGFDKFLTDHLYNVDLEDFSKINDVMNLFFKSKDKNLFAIQNKDDYNKYDIIMKEYIYSISKNIFDISEIDFDDINMDFYFENYIINFIKSILASLL